MYSLYSSFKSLLFSDQRELDLKNESKKLLSHVVKGEEEQAIAMIKACPRLLLMTSEARDYSDSRTIKQTPFQAALSANDSIMAKKMVPFFKDLQEVEPDEALRQFNSVFPQGIEEHDKILEKQSYDFTPLINTIINGSQEEKTNAISQFQECMKQERTVTEGFHFNHYDLFNAYQAYAAKYDTMQNKNNRDLFLNKVIGYIQRQMPANYAQAYCKGLHHFIDTGEVSTDRELTLLGGSPFYSDALGVDAAIFSFYCATKHNPGSFGSAQQWEWFPELYISKIEDTQAIKYEIASELGCDAKQMSYN